MQRLQLNPEESISRKEYLKRKKKEARKIKEINKSRMAIAVCMVLLGIYIVFQFVIYSRANNYKYLEGENVAKQDVYNMYYVTDGYTYDPVYSLSQINSNGFNDHMVYQSVGLYNIYTTKDYIYGMKSNSLYRIKKSNNELETIIDGAVDKYVIKDEEIYVIYGENSELRSLNKDTKQLSDSLGVSNVAEVLVDKDRLYLVEDKLTKKILVSINKDGSNKKELVTDANVSYIVQDVGNIYYVNKADENKIYVVDKEGKENKKLSDICSNSDKGELKEIDGSKYMVVSLGYLYYINVNENNSLWKINIATKENSVEISVPIEILQNKDNTLFYKMKNEMGVYLYNLDTKFMSQVTSRKVKEFYIDEKLMEQKIDYKKMNKN